MDRQSFTSHQTDWLRRAFGDSQESPGKIKEAGVRLD